MDIRKSIDEIELEDEDENGWCPGDFYMYLLKEDYKKIKKIAKELGWEKE